MPLTCKWAKNYFDDTNNKIGAILNDSGTVIEGIAQGASDAVDNKGIFYSVGYIIPSVFGEKGLDKAGDVITGLRGVEGASVLGQVSKKEKVLKVGKVEGKVTKGVKGLGGTKGIGKVEEMDGVKGASGVNIDDIIKKTGLSEQKIKYEYR